MEFLKPADEKGKPLKSKEGLFHIATSAVIENRDGKILLTRRSLERDHAPGEWELVTGRVNQGEKNIEDALRREIREEVGIQVIIIAPFRTFYFERGADKKPHFGVSFYCSYEGKDDAVTLDGTEQDDYKWTTPQEALSLIQDKNIQDGIRKYQDFRQHYYT